MSTPNPVPTGASLSDMLTAVKNLVTAINNASQNYININGALSTPAFNIATVVKASGGRIVTISVLTAGTTQGAVYDGATLAATTKPLIPIPNVVGAYRVGWPTSYGILVIPGAGQTVAASYS